MFRFLAHPFTLEQTLIKPGNGESLIKPGNGQPNSIQNTIKNDPFLDRDGFYLPACPQSEFLYPHELVQSPILWAKTSSLLREFPIWNFVR